MSEKYFVMLELDVRDGTNPRKWDWDNLIDSSGEEVIVKHVVCEEVYAEKEERQNVAGHIVEPPNRDEWVNWGRK